VKQHTRFNSTGMPKLSLATSVPGSRRTFEQMLGMNSPNGIFADNNTEKLFSPGTASFTTGSRRNNQYALVTASSNTARDDLIKP